VKKIYSVLALIAAVCRSGAAQDMPRAEVFLGYTYTRVNSATDVPAFSANGGSGQFVLNLGKWIGAVADVGAVHNGNIGGYHLDTTLTNFLFGPRIPIRVSNRVTPYFQTLFGGVYATSSYGLSNPAAPAPVAIADPATGRAAASQTAFAWAAGGGLDIKINKWVSFRPIGLDYFMTRLQNLRSAQDTNQHHLRYTAGFNFKVGGEKPLPPPPPPPPTKSCWNGTSVPVEQDCPKRVMNPRMGGAQPELCPGASISVTAGDVPDSATLQWTVNGQPISQGRTFEFGTTGREPGTYTIGLSASASDYNNAETTAKVTVLPYRAPSGTLQVSPAEIWAGESATLSARFDPGQCAGSLRGPEYSAAEGAVSGDRFDSSNIRFDPSDNSEQRKTVKLQARVADQRGVTAAEATVVVKKRAALAAKRLPDIVFPANSARVNNCGKRVLLEELKAMTQADPGGKVVLVGHTAAKEKKGGLDEQRAMNAAAVISASQGICSSFPASQIMVSSVGAEDNGVDLQPNFCGTSATPKAAELSGQGVNASDDQAKYRRVEVWFVPSNGILPASVKGAKEASTLPVKSLGCPK
jgi:outer membrane protein OmpA-like peptidoglycan-associated protein